MIATTFSTGQAVNRVPSNVCAGLTAVVTLILAPMALLRVLSVSEFGCPPVRGVATRSPAADFFDSAMIAVAYTMLSLVIQGLSGYWTRSCSIAQLHMVRRRIDAAQAGEAEIRPVIAGCSGARMPSKVYNVGDSSQLGFERACDV